MKILISTDSVSDLTPELLTKHNIPVLPLPITLGNDTFLDGKEVTPEIIFDFVEKNKILPKTSAINEFTYSQFFETELKNYDAIVHFTISSKLSLCYENAVAAAKHFEHVHVVDTQTLSSGIALLILKAVAMREKGKTAQDIVLEMEKLKKHVQATFVIETLDYLHKGGRCSGLQLLGANLLKLHPSIKVLNGKLEVHKKYKGKMTEVVENYIADTLKEFPNYDDSMVFVTHVGANQDLLNAAQTTLQKHGKFKQIVFTKASGTITSHCGKNTIGVLYITK